MEMRVNLDKESYSIHIQQGLLDHLLTYVQPQCAGKKIVIISDDHVFHYYGEKVKSQLQEVYDVYEIIMPHGELSKQWTVLTDIYQQLLDFQLTRTDAIVALGGGVIGDLAGFVASTYLRGLPFIQIPTSLLAQVDSSVGGKVAVDLPAGKNLVGAFKHPRLVLIDPMTLQTLDRRFLCDGMGEVIKYGCIFDKHLFQRLASYASFDEMFVDIDEIIYRCIDLKRQVVEKDVFDFQERLLLNFGHTLGHAIEHYYQYQEYSHGEAIAIGMVQISKIAELHGLSPCGLSQQIENVLKQYQLPVEAHLKTSDLKQVMALDKKNIHQSLSYILLEDIGKAYIYPSDLSFIDRVEEI